MLGCHRTRSHTTQTWMINEHYNKALLTRQIYISLLRILILHKVMNMLKKIKLQKSKHIHKVGMWPKTVHETPCPIQLKEFQEQKYTPNAQKNKLQNVKGINKTW
jgi:hypothetical protein